VLGKKSHLPEFVKAAVGNITLHPDSKVGKKAEQIFATIDYVGRYSLVMHELEKGTRLPDAVAKANGLYGDTDQVAPDMIQFFNDYPLGAQFMKWATQTTPMILKVAKDNPVKALALTMGLWQAKEQSVEMSEDNEIMSGGINTNSYNPVVSAIDFFGEQVRRPFNDNEEDTSVEITSNMNYLLPSYINKAAGRAYRRKQSGKKFSPVKEARDAILPKVGKNYTSDRRKLDLRSPTQQAIDLLFKN